MQPTIDTLTEEFAREHQDRLLSLGQDLDWHTWTPAHLLADRDEKWERSVVALDERRRPVGYVVASRQGRRVHVHQIVVAPELRGRRIGQALVDRLIRDAERDAIEAITSKALADNDDALAFHRAMGFGTCGMDEHGQVLMKRRVDVPAARAAGKLVAIHQPNYAPWCGFFAKAAHCDTFVLLDDVQMPRGRSWVHRTRIAMQGTERWLSVPCRRSSTSAIRDVELADDGWPVKHLRTLEANYGRARCFDETMALIAPLYDAPGRYLAEFNSALVVAVSGHLGVTPEWVRSSDLESHGTGEERIISLTRAAGGTTYLSGPGANAYQTQESFDRAGLKLAVREYVPLGYAQSAGEFIPGLSVLDALFHCGRDAAALLHYAGQPDPRQVTAP